jgi:hypothetical protein
MSGFKERFIAAQERLNRPERLGSLVQRGAGILCWCNRCAHRSRLEARRLSLMLGPDFPVPEVGARLRCTNCGAKDVATSVDLSGDGSARPRAAPRAAMA